IAKEADGSPRLVVTNKNAMRYGLPESYAKTIENLPDVVAVNRMVWFAGTYNDPHRQFPSVAIDVDNPEVIWPENGFDAGPIAAFRKSRNGALVGTALMERFGWKIGQQVVLRSQLYPVKLTFVVVGSYHGGPDPTVFMFRRDYLEEALHNTGRVDMIWVRCSSPEVADRIAGEIDSTFRNSGTETETASEKTFLVTFMVRFQSLGRLIQAVGLCAVFAIALAVLNGASMTVRERRQEIAVLHTLGFPSLPIAFSLVGEASLTALVGGIAGTLLASTGMNAARAATRVLGPALSVGVPYPVMLGAIAIALLIGIISALVPTLAALRSPAANSLRHIA